MIVDAAAGKMPAYVDSGLNIVHVDDVAQGHLLAATHGRSGRHYVLGSENMTLKDIFSAVAAMTGVHAPRLKLPVGMILPVAHIAEAVARVTNKPPMVTVDGVKLARKHMYFSSQRAIDELGYQPRPALTALKDAVDWFAANDYL
jgi:dihydroflavonol-4-reductase